MEFHVSRFDDEQLSIEEGTDCFVDVEESSDEEVIEWAEENGYLEDPDYLLPDGSPDIERLKESKFDADVQIFNEYPPAYATPSGRAYSWFEKLAIKFPKGIELIDGPYPGNDWQGVVVLNHETLILLQKFLEDNGSKVNFYQE
jgi:hypothetical protein